MTIVFEQNLRTFRELNFAYDRKVQLLLYVYKISLYILKTNRVYEKGRSVHHYNDRNTGYCK